MFSRKFPIVKWEIQFIFGSMVIFFHIHPQETLLFVFNAKLRLVFGKEEKNVAPSIKVERLSLIKQIRASLNNVFQPWASKCKI